MEISLWIAVNFGKRCAFFIKRSSSSCFCCKYSSSTINASFRRFYGPAGAFHLCLKGQALGLNRNLSFQPLELSPPFRSAASPQPSSASGALCPPFSLVELWFFLDCCEVWLAEWVKRSSAESRWSWIHQLTAAAASFVTLSQIELCACVCVCSLYGTAKEESKKQKETKCSIQRRRDVEFINRRSRRC